MSITELKKNISHRKIVFFIKEPKIGYQFPRYDILVSQQSGFQSRNYNEEDSYFDTIKNRRKVVEYDINRVSSRNAKRGDKSPYKTSELRHIILSYNMGKATGSKKDLVSTILSFHKSRNN